MKYVLEPNLCDGLGIRAKGDPIIAEICEDESSSEICEVKIEKGSIDEIEIHSCTAFCNVHELRCVNAYKDWSGCTRRKTTSCDDEFALDMICSCEKIGIHTTCNDR